MTAVRPPAIESTMDGLEAASTDRRLPRARIAALASLGSAVLTSLIFPSLGLLSEPAALWLVLGAIGILAFAAAQAGALYAAVTPWLTPTVRRRLLVAFALAGVLSIPLVGPVGDERSESWAWLAGSLVGSAPLLLRGRAAAAVIVATVAVAVGLATSTGGSVGDYLLITVGVGLMVAAMGALPVWLWRLLVDAQAGREAQGRLAAAEERLRFARDVHDLLGHNLSVIALKGELAARLAAVDPDRAAREAAEVRGLAASALLEVREAVHGYRAVDLREQLSAIERLLASSGIRCTVILPEGDLPPAAAARLAAVLREASTNVLRHSRARWCTIEIERQRDEVRMTVVNDGVVRRGPDRHSQGLHGLAERLAEGGGVLEARAEDGIFTLDAILPVKQ